MQPTPSSSAGQKRYAVFQPRDARSSLDANAPPLPQNREAERAVLGAILLDNKQLDIALEKLTTDDFFDHSHRHVFQHMRAMRDESVPIDLVTLTERMHRTGELEAAGGAAYLASLVDGIPRISNVEHYASIVQDLAIRRRVIHAAAAITQRALAGDEKAEEILRSASQMLDGLRGNSASSWREVFHSFADFETAAPLRFAIDGFLQNDGATLIGGLSGHGKTLILLSIVKALLLAGKGKLLWNYFRVAEPAVRCLYLIPECAIAPFKHRLRLFGLYPCLAPDDDRLLVRTLSKGPTPCLADPRILHAAKGAHVFLDTAVRFSAEGNENDAGDNQRGLASDIFALLASGARSVVGAHHSPKPFARENVMRLENVLRGSGDIGAMLTTAWGIKQLDPEQNVIQVENIKPRDFLPCGPFQLRGRPAIDQTGDFAMHKRPGECGALMDEQQSDRDPGGAPIESRLERARRIAMVKEWLDADAGQTTEQLRMRFEQAGIKVGSTAVKNYKRGAQCD